MYSKQNVGNAGEYYFASILSAHDFISTITLGRAEKYDILAVSNKGKTFKFSVKTRFFNADRFPLSKKDETGGADDFFYIFVRLNEFKTEPNYWIIPSLRVNQVIKESHQFWINQPGVRVKNRKDSDMRNFWLVINRTSMHLFPKNWEKELEKYYKNIKQLK